MGGGGDTTTSTQRILPPWQAKEFKRAIQEAGKLYDRPLSYYPESTVAQRSNFSTMAAEDTAKLSGQEYRTASKDFLTQTVRGDFMEGNPEIDKIARIIAENTTSAYKRGTAPSTMSRFAGAGRGYSDAADSAVSENEKNLGRALYEGETNLRYGDYNQRMKERLAALGLVPTFQGMDVQDINQERAQGAIEEDYSQRLLDDIVKRYQFRQTEPESRLDRYLGRVGGESPMGGTVSTGPSGTNPGMSIGLSVLSAAATVAGSFFGGVGALAGPAIGAIGSSVMASSQPAPLTMGSMAPPVSQSRGIYGYGQMYGY